MREWLGPLLPGSLLILDEAHHAAPSSGGRYGIETKFTRAIRDLGGRFEHRLFLSATPHNGHSNSFSTLLELLDPYRFTRGVKVRGRKALEEVMVRRLKEDIREVQGGFPRREVVRLVIDGLPPDAPELVLSRLLDEYRTAREAAVLGHLDPHPGGGRRCSLSVCSSVCCPRSRRSRAASRSTSARSSGSDGPRRDQRKLRRCVTRSCCSHLPAPTMSAERRATRSWMPMRRALIEAVTEATESAIAGPRDGSDDLAARAGASRQRWRRSPSAPATCRTPRRCV